MYVHPGLDETRTHAEPGSPQPADALVTTTKEN